MKTFLGVQPCHPEAHYCNTLRRFSWGNPEMQRREKDDEKNAPKVEAKPVFELSGALARDTNKVNVGGGQIVVLKYAQPRCCSATARTNNAHYDRNAAEAATPRVTLLAGTRSPKMRGFPPRNGACERSGALFMLRVCQCASVPEWQRHGRDRPTGTCLRLGWTRSWRCRPRFVHTSRGT
jgi:hypothetical protein